MSTPPDPTPAVIEWGGDPGRGRWPRRLDPRFAWLVGGLGVLALFGSLVGEWQVTEVPFETGFSSDWDKVPARLTALGTWGTGWLVGAMALAACVGLALFGTPPLRPAARASGLAVAGAAALVLAAATVHLQVESVLDYRFGLGGVPTDLDLEIRLGRGLYAAYAALGLLAAALWLARVPVGPASTAPAPPSAAPGPAPVDSGPAEPQPAAAGPGDLTVGPAEPFAHPDDGHELR